MNRVLDSRPAFPLNNPRGRGVKTGVIGLQMQQIVEREKGFENARESADSSTISATSELVAGNDIVHVETVRDPPKPSVPERGAEPSDADLETAIVRAVTAGAIDVATVLAAQLADRRRTRGARAW